MKNLNFQIEDKLHEQLKMRAVQKKITLKELITQLLKEGLK